MKTFLDKIIPDVNKAIRLSESDVEIWKSDIIRYLAKNCLECVAERAERIIKSLVGNEELFWLYGYALIDYYDRKAANAFSQHLRKNRNIFNATTKELQKDKITHYDFGRVIKGIDCIPTKKDIDYLKKKIVENYRKDSSWSSSPILREVVVLSVIIVDELNQNKPETKSGHIEPTIKEACGEVYRHLKLFGIDLGTSMKVKYMYHNYYKMYYRSVKL